MEVQVERVYKRPEFIYYQDALDAFTEARHKLNECIENDSRDFRKHFNEYKEKAEGGDVIAMDIVAYYYKTGVPNLLPENYDLYIRWELLSAARGNEFAIEKLQFILNYAMDSIIASEDYETIVYKNDIDDHNLIYVLGKALCKMLVKEMKIYLEDMKEARDIAKPYIQEAFISLRKNIDDVVQKTIEYLKS